MSKNRFVLAVTKSCNCFWDTDSGFMVVLFSGLESPCFFRACLILFFVSSKTSESKNARATSSSERYHKCLKTLLRAALAMVSSFSLYFCSLCRRSKSERGALMAMDAVNHDLIYISYTHLRAHETPE